MSVELQVVEDPAAECAELLVEVASCGGHIVVAGGSTPRAAYQQAAEKADAWAGATVWFGDERCVPPDDERSNYLMVKEALLDALTDVTVHRMKGELGFAEGADDYELELREAGLERFDLLLLGIGSDGHTASLFPGQPTLSERSRLVVGVERAGLEPFVPRISFTLTAIERGERVVVLVSGASKADAVSRAFGPDAKPDRQVPSSLLATLDTSVTVLLDAPAAGRR
jgi:6-phosphogluconolactonase